MINSAYHISFYNRFEKEFSDLISYISNNYYTLFGNKEYYISYDKKLNYKLYLSNNELKYFFRLKDKYNNSNFIDIHYYNENKWYIAFTNKNIIIKSKLSLLTFIKEYIYLLEILSMYKTVNNIDNISKINFDLLLNDNINKLNEYIYLNFISAILNNKNVKNIITSNSSLSEKYLINYCDIYFIENINDFSFISDEIKDNISDKVKKEYDYLFNASNFDLI